MQLEQDVGITVQAPEAFFGADFPIKASVSRDPWTSWPECEIPFDIRLLFPEFATPFQVGVPPAP